MIIVIIRTMKLKSNDKLHEKIATQNFDTPKDFHND